MGGSVDADIFIQRLEAIIGWRMSYVVSNPIAKEWLRRLKHAKAEELPYIIEEITATDVGSRPESLLLQGLIRRLYAAMSGSGHLTGSNTSLKPEKGGEQPKDSPGDEPIH
jgi:hypothetical protein